MFIRNAYECYFCLILGLLFRVRTKNVWDRPKDGGAKKCLVSFSI